MLQEQIYNYLLQVLRTETDIEFAGGYTYVNFETHMSVINLDNLQAMRYEEVNVVPFAESFINERPYSEKINRRDFEGEYTVIYPIEKDEECKEALETFRNYMFNNQVATIEDDGITYQVKFKTTSGQRRAVTPTEDGTIYVVYAINVFLTTTEKGYISDNAVLKIAKDGETLVELDTIDYSINSEVGMTTSPKFIDTNIENEPQSRAVGGSIQFYYERDSAIHKELLKQVSGKISRNQVYNLVETIDGEEFTYDIYVKKGDRNVTKGGNLYMTISWVEK